MISAKERQKLVENFERDQFDVVAMRVKCAVCIAVIGGIAFIGYQAEPALQEASGGPPAQHRTSVAVAQAEPPDHAPAPHP
jgi:hypothetical protein